jgi:hypothetical protein
MAFNLRYQCITRRGVIEAKTETDNQCRAKGHKKYYYEIAILFTPDTVLDENQFILDHALIDAEVQKVEINSCEVMSKTIMDNVDKLLCGRGLGCVGMKLRIQHEPELPLNGPYFREIACNDVAHLPAILAL